MSDLALAIDIANRDPESIKTVLGTMPCFAGSGGHIVEVSHDLKCVDVAVPLNDATRNVVGCIYGGSMYGASDAIYLMLLWFQLGDDYFLVDRSSKVEYLRPGLSDVRARCSITDDMIDGIRAELVDRSSCTRIFYINFINDNNKSVCKIEKTVYIRKNSKIARNEKADPPTGDRLPHSPPAL